MKRVLCAAAILQALACQSYSFVFQPASQVVGQTQEVTDSQPFSSDILFVIDNSGSMATKQAKLEASMSAFINVLAATQNNYQIGITTTSENCTYVAPSPNPWDGLCGRLFSPDGANAIISRADYPDPSDLIARFNYVVSKVGTAGSPYEQGLKAAADAVSEVNTGVGKPNAGFVRPDALLTIIFVSDESDCSYSYDDEQGLVPFTQGHYDTGESCYAIADQLQTAAYWQQIVLAVKTRQLLVAVGTITAGVDDANGNFVPSECNVGSDGHATNQCSCFYESPLSYCAFTQDTTPPAGQQVECNDPTACCTSLANARYSQYTDLWQQHIQGSVCEADYSNIMFQIAQISINDCFTVNPPPAGDDPTNLQVERRQSGQTQFSLAPNITKTQALSGGNGWYYETDPTTTGEKVHEVCLAGSYQRQIGDTYKIFVLSSTQGSTSNVSAP